nr:MAG TPA: YopX protein [Caudoviricetes sp.]
MMIQKYRAWDKVSRRMIVDEQEFIPLIVTNKGVFRLSPHYGENLYEKICLNRFEIMQSTGMKDKNGTEIYEGDIVKPVSFASWIGVVKYSSENAAYILDDHNNEFIRSENVYLSQFNEGLEIIGNIYENVNLIESILE